MPEDVVPEDALIGATREIRDFAKVGLRDDSARRRLRLLEQSPVLRSLPAAKAAGEDSTAQFEYLVQAITDAIDAINLSGSVREAEALRALFGLTASTRRTTWRARQESAALVLHFSWDHFRHSIQGELLRAVCERVVANGNRLGRGGQLLQEASTGLVACRSQLDVEAELISYVRNQRPRSALLCELSTATVLPLLCALRDAGTHIRLLVANPDRSGEGWLRARLEYSLADLLTELGDYDLLDLKVYSVPPSLRGRIIGSYILLGSYTYRDNKRLEAFDPAATETWGHDNAVVLGNTSEFNATILDTWFRREYERLWAHRLTRGGEYLRPILGLDT